MPLVEHRGMTTQMTVDHAPRTIDEIDYAHVSILTGDAPPGSLWTSPETGLADEICSDVSGAR